MRSYLRTLLANPGPTNSRTITESAGERGSKGVQRLLNAATWDEDGVRDDVRDIVVRALGDPWQGRLALSAERFHRRGSSSAGAVPTNRSRSQSVQIGLFLGYASTRGIGLVDRELLTSDAGEVNAHDTAEFGHCRYEHLAWQMIDRAIRAEVPFAWVSAGRCFGETGELSARLDTANIAYTIEVSPTYVVTTANLDVSTARSAVDQLPPSVWHRISHPDESGEYRVRDWAATDLRRTGGVLSSWLLAGRSISDPSDLEYYLCGGPASSILSDLARVAAGTRAVDACLAVARGELGLGDYQVRARRAWYRHMTLVIAAVAYWLIIDMAARGLSTSHDSLAVRPARSRPDAGAPWW